MYPGIPVHGPFPGPDWEDTKKSIALGGLTAGFALAFATVAGADAYIRDGTKEINVVDKGGFTARAPATAMRCATA